MLKEPRDADLDNREADFVMSGDEAPAQPVKGKGKGAKGGRAGGKAKGAAAAPKGCATS